MNNNFYAGHCIEWTQKFINTIYSYNKKNKKTLCPSRAFCIACALQHKYTLEKKTTITLNHKTLDDFKVSARRLKIYLQLFEQAGLISFCYKIGAAPKITLISLPTQYVINDNKNKRIIDKRNLYQSVEVTSTKVPRLPIPKCLGSKTALVKTRPTDKTHRQTRPTDKREREINDARS